MQNSGTLFSWTLTLDTLMDLYALIYLAIKQFGKHLSEETTKQNLTVESIGDKRSSFMSQIFCQTEVKID